MQFKLFEHLAEDQGQQTENPKFEQMVHESDEKTLQFIEEEIQKQAVLLYCTTEFRDVVLA